MRLSLALQSVCPCGCNAPPAGLGAEVLAATFADEAADEATATSADEAAAPPPPPPHPVARPRGRQIPQDAVGSGESAGTAPPAQPAQPSFLQPWVSPRIMVQEKCSCSGHCGNSGHKYRKGCSEQSVVRANRPRRQSDAKGQGRQGEDSIGRSLGQAKSPHDRSSFRQGRGRRRRRRRRRGRGGRRKKGGGMDGGVMGGAHL